MDIALDYANLSETEVTHVRSPAYRVMMGEILKALSDLTTKEASDFRELYGPRAILVQLMTLAHISLFLLQF